jgi:hypothetical protein
METDQRYPLAPRHSLPTSGLYVNVLKTALGMPLAAELPGYPNLPTEPVFEGQAHESKANTGFRSEPI